MVLTIAIHSMIYIYMYMVGISPYLGHSMPAHHRCRFFSVLVENLEHLPHCFVPRVSARSLVSHPDALPVSNQTCPQVSEPYVGEVLYLKLCASDFKFITRDAWRNIFRRHMSL